MSLFVRSSFNYWETLRPFQNTFFTVNSTRNWLPRVRVLTSTTLLQSGLLLLVDSVSILSSDYACVHSLFYSRLIT